jgi:NADH-quinone oxidoreductase subunit L
MQYIICFALLMPLLGFLTLVASANKISRRLAGYIGCGTVLIAFICFASLLFKYITEGMHPQTFTIFNWIHVKDIEADFALLMDPLALLMTLIITGVGFLIHVYSIGYMEHDKDYARYFAFMNFFIFAMLLLVLSGNLLLLFVGWEGVGLASYLLIGFWYTRPVAAQAATKAFVVNRIGDLGFLLALLLTFYMFGTSDIAKISEKVRQSYSTGDPILTLLLLLYFIGAIGKSAQLPLYTWLPDAMAGPTPVSALIHAATMVTAGVYLVVRLHVLYSLSPLALQVVGVVGAVTALFASLCAIGQTDLKRVLAYSTVSQIGLMFLACGASAFYSAMFHLTTHAFVKALLFLSAGNVIHMLHDLTDMRQMGGLSKIFKKTHWLFFIGVLALSGIPPLATFFSKDLILEQEYFMGFKALFYIGLAASVLTGFYLMRAYCLTFTGTSHQDKQTLDATHEAPPVMLIPVILLGLLAIGGGFLGFELGKTPVLESLLSEVGVTPAEKELSTNFVLSPGTWMAILGSFFGVGLSAYIYTRFTDHPLSVLKKSFYINELYDRLFVRPLQALARFIATIFEPKVFDGSIQGLVNVVQVASRWLQKIQSGEIRSYVAWMVFGTVFLMVYFAF